MSVCRDTESYIAWAYLRVVTIMSMKNAMKNKNFQNHTLLVLMYNCEFIFGRHQKSVKCFVKWKSIKLLFFLKNSQLDAAPLDVPVNI